MAQRVTKGSAKGTIVVLEEGLSFWGGVDAATGVVIDAHHALRGQSLAGKIVMMPTSRGSCTGSGVLLELIQNGHAPAALIFREAEDVLTLGALVGERVFGMGLPVLRLAAQDYAALAGAGQARIGAEQITAAGIALPLNRLEASGVALSAQDRQMLDGAQGMAAQIAMQIIVEMAALQGAQELVSVTRVHIDGCIYASPANLRFAVKMAEMGAQVAVPTTMNAISVDHANWRKQGVPPGFGLPASQLADAYVAMGAKPSFTCAPYLLAAPPEAGEMIAWAESNAVIFANTVLAARTVKHPDFLDLCIALTGRAPLSGVYLDDARAARRIIAVTPPARHDDALWPMLGYLAGQMSPDRIPLLTGLGGLTPTQDDLKALCAAFGTTSAAPMLHIAGVTPEAHLIAADADHVAAGPGDLARIWRQFNAGPPQVDLVAFGSPHFSLSECRSLARALAGRVRHAGTRVIVTLGRDVLAAAQREGVISALQASGVQCLPDLCWCSISEPVFPPQARVLMTNSGKYAHYGPGLSGRAVRFGGMADCVTAALTGEAPEGLPDWLREE